MRLLQFFIQSDIAISAQAVINYKLKNKKKTFFIRDILSHTTTGFPCSVNIDYLLKIDLVRVTLLAVDI